MARDPLPALLRVRRMALDEARRLLAARLQEEADAEADALGAERAILTEADAARALTADDGVVETFAAWLPGARRRAEAARAAQEAAQAETSLARAGLQLARAAVEAAEALQTRQAEGRAAEAARKEQIALDDMAPRRPAP